MADQILRQFQRSLEGKSPDEAKEMIDDFLRQIAERKEQSLDVMETLGATGTILQRLRRFYRNTVGGDAPMDIVELSQNFYDNIFKRIPMSSQNLGRGILLGLRIGIPLAVTVMSKKKHIFP
jgi:ABC-type dipeptide/oligopeptide/nickel transport system permease component